MKSNLMVLRSYGLMVFLLSILAVANAQTDENIILNPDSLQKNELIVTPEIKERVIDAVYWMYEKFSESSRSRIKKWSQSEYLELGKPIPMYRIENEKLLFTNTWHVPVFSDGEPLVLVDGVIEDNFFSFFGCQETPIEERIHNYVHKDLIIGTLNIKRTYGIDYLIIRKEHKDIFVEVYDEATGEYCKNEYSFSELINRLKELDLRKKEAQNRHYAQIANKSELEMTPEITKMLVTRIQQMSEKFYSNYGIKNRSQLNNLEFGKPIPMYGLHNDSLQFTGKWEVHVMSDGEPLRFEIVKLEDDGRYRWAGGGNASMVEAINNYEYKDLIIGFLGIETPLGRDYLIIRKNGKDIFVKTYDWDTREVFKTEYSLNDIINLNKK